MCLLLLIHPYTKPSCARTCQRNSTVVILNDDQTLQSRIIRWAEGDYTHYDPWLWKLQEALNKRELFYLMAQRFLVRLIRRNICLNRSVCNHIRLYGWWLLWRKPGSSDCIYRANKKEFTPRLVTLENKRMHCMLAYNNRWCCPNGK